MFRLVWSKTVFLTEILALSRWSEWMIRLSSYLIQLNPQMFLLLYFRVFNARRM